MRSGIENRCLLRRCHSDVTLIVYDSIHDGGLCIGQCQFVHVRERLGLFNIAIVSMVTAVNLVSMVGQGFP